MKTRIPQNRKSVITWLTLIALIFFGSCSPEPELNSADLDATQARSRNKNDKKSQNAELRTLVKGSRLSGANGLDVGPDGHLYIASVQGQEIVVMNKNNGKIVTRFGKDNGVLGPDDLIIDPDGEKVYWTDILTGEVGQMNLDGSEMLKQYVAPGVNPIRFSDDGRLFVALDFLGEGLYELDPDFNAPPRHIVSSFANPINPFGFFNSFDFGPDGLLYGPLFDSGYIIKVNVDPPGPIPSSDPFGESIAEIVAEGFFNPAAAKFGPNGMLYVLDQTGELFKIDTSTGEKMLFTTLQPGLDNMTFDEDGTLYMTNNDEGWVAEILPSGQARYISPGGVIAPQGLAVLPGPNNQDMLYEADLFRLRQFNGTSGQQVNNYKGFLIRLPGSNVPILPMNISSDGENLIVSSWFSGEVQIWDSMGNVLETYVMDVPINAIGFKGDVIVADLVLGGLVWSDQSYIDLGGASLFVVSGLTTDGETVWVADWATGLIWEIEFDGIIPKVPVIVASGLDQPEGLAYEAEGSLVVVETGTSSQLSRIDLSTGEVTKIVDGLKLSGPALPGFPPTWRFDGVAVGLSGDIYISGGGENAIYKVK